MNKIKTLGLATLATVLSYASFSQTNTVMFNQQTVDEIKKTDTLKIKQEKFLYVKPLLDEGDKKTKNIDDITESILAYCCNYRNLNFEERKNIFEKSRSKKFRKMADDSIKTLEYFPILEYFDSVSYPYVLDLFMNNGNPKIRVRGFFRGSDREYYNPLSNTIIMHLMSDKSLPKDMSIQLSEAYFLVLFPELSHSVQFRKKLIPTIGKTMVSFSRVFVKGLFQWDFWSAYEDEYSIKGSLEYEAHEIIEPKITEDYNQYLDQYSKKDELSENFQKTLEDIQYRTDSITLEIRKLLLEIETMSDKNYQEAKSLEKSLLNKSQYISNDE
jgi:hypothetical protein